MKLDIACTTHEEEKARGLASETQTRWWQLPILCSKSRDFWIVIGLRVILLSAQVLSVYAALKVRNTFTDVHRPAIRCLRGRLIRGRETLSCLGVDDS